MKHRAAPPVRRPAFRVALVVLSAGVLVGAVALGAVEEMRARGDLAAASTARPPARPSPGPRLLERGSLPNAPRAEAPKPRPAKAGEPSPAATAEPRTLRMGDEGKRVRDLQLRLDELGYVIATVDGVYGEETHHAVMAFQKVNGLARDGIAGPQTMGALDRPKRPKPRSTIGFHVEVDLARQVLFVVSGGKVVEIYNSSTGSGETYYVDGDARVATTPIGAYAVERRIDGLRVSHLGELYRPAYFVGGYAIHGSPSVPGYPASHGCVRVTNQVMDRLFDRLETGTEVILY